MVSSGLQQMSQQRQSTSPKQSEDMMEISGPFTQIGLALPVMRFVSMKNMAIVGIVQEAREAKRKCEQGQLSSTSSTRFEKKKKVRT